MKKLDLTGQRFGRLTDRRPVVRPKIGKYNKGGVSLS
jgi:hypothetical protein